MTTASEFFAAPPTTPRRAPRDPGGLAKVVLVLLWAHAGGASVSALIGFAALTSGRFALLSASDLAAVGVVVLLLAAGPAFIAWTYRVHRNARAFGAVLHHPDWMAWAGWFIPLASLVIPYRIITQAWRGSARPGSAAGDRVPSTFRWWWGLFLVASVIGSATLQVQDVQVLLVLGILSDLLMVLALLPAQRVVRMVTGRQMARVHGVPPDPLTAPAHPVWSSPVAPAAPQGPWWGPPVAPDPWGHHVAPDPWVAPEPPSAPVVLDPWGAPLAPDQPPARGGFVPPT